MKFGGPERHLGKPSDRERELKFENTILRQDLARSGQDSLEDGLRLWDYQVRLEKDHLTGAASLVEFDTQLEQAVRMAHRGTPSSLLYLDVDYFKQVNDKYGHAGGDVVLKQVSAFLINACRESDIVARIGGEEFAILMPGSDGSSSEKAEKLREGIENLTFPEYPELKVTASFGVVSLDASIDSATARKRADEALYRAKNSGRNRVEISNEL